MDRTLALTLLSLPLLACPHSDIKDVPDDTAAQTIETGDAQDTSSPQSGIRGTLAGNVTVQVYSTDEDGEMVLLDWDDAYGGLFPYGDIFVAAYTEEAETGRIRYHGETSILSPTTTANPYEIDVQDMDIEEVWVYAALDFWGEGVIGTGDPIAHYGVPLSPHDGETINDIDIQIMAIMQSGGGSCDTMAITGSVNIVSPYVAGDVCVMLLSTSNVGPMHTWVDWLTPTDTLDGATGEYAFGACQNDGEAKLVAAWDSNVNSIIDPSDTWGAYSNEPDVDGNPIDIGLDDLLGMDIQIPLGDDAPLQIIPFVRLSGQISMTDGTALGNLPEGTTVAVAAAKSRPMGEQTEEDLDTSYDYVIIPWEDLNGQTMADYTLSVPLNTIAYLWAWADTDGDGQYNETGEPVGSGGHNATGRISTGESHQADLNIDMMLLEE